MSTFPLVSDELLKEVGDLGLAHYERLRPTLEPAYDGKFVAIYVDTGDYYIARTSGQATRDLLKHHPLDGRVMVRKIGNEPEWGLISRLYPMGVPDSARSRIPETRRK